MTKSWNASSLSSRSIARVIVPVTEQDHHFAAVGDLDYRNVRTRARSEEGKRLKGLGVAHRLLAAAVVRAFNKITETKP